MLAALRLTAVTKAAAPCLPTFAGAGKMAVCGGLWIDFSFIAALYSLCSVKWGQ